MCCSVCTILCTLWFFIIVQYLFSVDLCLLYIRTLLVLCGSPPHCTVHVRTLWFSVIVQYMYVLCGSLSFYSPCTLWFSVLVQYLYSVVLRSCTVLVLGGFLSLYLILHVEMNMYTIECSHFNPFLVVVMVCVHTQKCTCPH